MQVQDLIKYLQEGKLLEELLITQPHIPSSQKKIIADQIIDICTYQDENSITKINYFNKIITKNILLITNYSNLEFGDNSIDELDFLIVNKIFDSIINDIDPGELKFIDSLLEDELGQIVRVDNSVEVLLAKGINKLLDKLPTDKQLKSLSKSLIKDLGKLDTNKVAELKDMFGIAGGNKVN